MINLTNNYLHVLSSVFRLYHSIRNPKSRKARYLTAAELDQEVFLVRYVQGIEFFHELKSLSKGELIAPVSKLKCLIPFLDRFRYILINLGLIRVGVRLQNSDLIVDQKHPVFLRKVV